MKFTMSVGDLNRLITAANTYGDKTRFSDGKVVVKMTVEEWRNDVCYAKCYISDTVAVIQVFVRLVPVAEEESFCEGAFDSFYMVVPSKKYKAKPETVGVEIEKNITRYRHGGVTEEVMFDADVESRFVDQVDTVGKRFVEKEKTNDITPLVIDPARMIAALELFAKEGAKVQIDRVDQYILRIQPNKASGVCAQSVIAVMSPRKDAEYFQGRYSI